MQLKNDIEGRNALRDLIASHYGNGRQHVSFVSDEINDESFKMSFLLERKHVIQYSIGKDRGLPIGVVALAIGPYFFPPSEFWSYEQAQRFSLDTTPQAIEQNLSLLDEFLRTQ